ncbi:MAG: polysaccharide pyruvyl transferase family protein [Planctomycetaceae bacterium]|nr:polysaccharide pyruvyl transferase family protein [Planctomycetaceae bacterium]
MKKIVLYSPAISTMNLGDQIIWDGVAAALRPMFPGAFYVEISTHLPVSTWYMRLLADADLRFVCGTNLISSTMNRFRQWNVNHWTAGSVGPAILLGVGWWQYQQKPNLYSRLLLRRLLSSTHLHSVRDRYTADKLASIGIRNVVNTGCPSMWGLTAEHCGTVPRDKADSVIFTLTDYKQEPKADRRLVAILKGNYRRVRFWTQGWGDLDYFRSLDAGHDIEVIEPSLMAYDRALDEEDVDYVGTRLHAGIRALQRRRRALILGVDNRAMEKQKDFCLNVLDRQRLDELPSRIREPIKTEIRLPGAEIRRWLSQFDEDSK